MSGKSKKNAFRVPSEWTFQTPTAAAAFDAHVRESLPWYDLVTGAVVHIARAFIPHGGLVLDVGASTGNVGRALNPVLDARRAELIAIDNSEAMADVYSGPGDLVIADAADYDFWQPRQPDVVICFLSLMFVPTGKREAVIMRMKQALKPGGAIIIVDKIAPQAGYGGTVNYRLTLAAKHEAGATAEDILRKELSLNGLQRPLENAELDGFQEFFRFGDFVGRFFCKL